MTTGHVSETAARERRRALLAQTLQAKIEKPFVAPLSFAQERIWLLEQLQPGLAVYNLLHVLPLMGPLNVNALQQSLNEIIRRHEILRTRFLSQDGEPRQEVVSTFDLAIRRVDLRSMLPATRAAEGQRLALREARQIFHLDQTPLLSALLVQLEDTHSLLMLTLHHIVSDGGSLHILTHELEVLYECYASGQPGSLAERSLQYVDFAQWQRKWMQGDRLRGALSYWRQQLAGAPICIALPNDRPRPPQQSYQGAWQAFEISSDLAGPLYQLCLDHGVTPFMALLATFQVLLYRLTDEADLLIGTPIDNRNNQQLEGMIGCLINTLVLRTSLKGNPSFDELLQRVKQVTLDAYTHQEMPFEHLLNVLEVERHLSHGPLFQVMFSLQNAPRAKRGNQPETQTFKSVLPDVAAGIAKFDLSLFMEETPTGFLGTFEYSTDLFDHATITRWTDHFKTLLKSALTSVDRSVSTLTLLTATEEDHIRNSWNDTAMQLHAADDFVHLFESQAARTPDNTAVIGSGSRYTYRQLNARANQLGQLLRSRGVHSEVKVGLYLDRSEDMLVALLAIAKAGGAYLPLDLSFPAARIEAILADAQPALVITESGLSPAQSGATASPEWLETFERDGCVLRLDSQVANLGQWSGENFDCQRTASSLAYVIYTSGSTGTPKGVQISRLALTNFLLSMAKSIPLTEQDCLYAVTTLSFDIAALELLLPVLCGACVTVASRKDTNNGERLIAAIEGSGANIMQATPATWDLLLSCNWEPQASFRILCGGAPLPRDLANRLLDSSAAVYNLYGPTETTVYSSFTEVRQESGSVNVGRAITNTDIYILDAQMQIVPIGVKGEIYIGGMGLARGYANRPAQTAAAFVPHPFSNRLGERLYKTADIGRFGPDGHLECCGRNDYQVKVRGFRIELGEIEASLRRHPAVVDAAVIYRRDEENVSLGRQGERLTAFFSCSAATAPSVDSLQAFLRERLPDYMLPSEFVLVDKLPLTTSGKIDRSALLSMQPAAEILSAPFSPPTTPLQRVIADVWEEVLGKTQVSVDANFFRMGGHSLLAVQAVSRIRELLQVSLPLALLFEQPTVALLADALRADPVEAKRLDENADTLLMVATLSEEEARHQLAGTND